MVKKVALVTGASRGIGAATAKLLAKHHYAVCVNFHRSRDQAEQVVDEIIANGGEAIALQADIGDEKDITQLFDTVDRKWGPLTALVNNVGDNGGISLVEEISIEKLQKVFALNVFGTFLCSREAVKRMKQAGGGSIVNVSSEAGKFGGNKLAHYAAAKAAVNTFTIGFAREVAPYNIRVNAVSPGVIDTDIHATSPPDRIVALIKSLPMDRMGTTEEVANLISWLLSESASYVSGAIIPITGAR